MKLAEQGWLVSRCIPLRQWWWRVVVVVVVDSSSSSSSSSSRSRSSRKNNSTSTKSFNLTAVDVQVLGSTVNACVPANVCRDLGSLWPSHWRWTVQTN